MTQNPTVKPFVEVLSGHRQPVPPLWMMRQAGRYLPEYREVRAKAGGFLDLCFTPEFAAEVTLQPIRRFNFDAAIIFSDILVIPYALGRSVRFEVGEGPRLDPLDTPDKVGTLAAHADFSKLEPVFEALRRVRRELDPKIALIGFCGAPWTVATYMVAGQGTPDQAPARMMAYRHPEAFAKIIDAVVENSIIYLLGQLKAGADVLQIFDTWAGVLPPREFQRWSIEPTKRIVEGVRKQVPGREDHRLPARRRRVVAILCRGDRRRCRQHRLGGRAVADPRASPKPRRGTGQSRSAGADRGRRRARSSRSTTCCRITPRAG